MGTFTIAQIKPSADLFLYPNADGCNIDFTPVGATNNWECVDDNRIIPDEDATYNYSASVNLKHDLYRANDHKDIELKMLDKFLA